MLYLVCGQVCDCKHVCYRKLYMILHLFAIVKWGLINWAVNGSGCMNVCGSIPPHAGGSPPAVGSQ